MASRPRFLAVVRGIGLTLLALAGLVIFSLLGQRYPWLATAATLGLVLLFVLLIALSRRDDGFIVNEED